MDELYYTPKHIRAIYDVKHDNKTIAYHESNKHIPPSAKQSVGALKNVSCWTAQQLPDIGRFYGKLKRQLKQTIIVVYMGKGGVLKTTLSYNIARTLALNGIDVLIIGLDTQVSMTTLALKPEQYFDLKNFKECEGLDDFVRKGASLEKIIKPTDLPTLDILPETSNLNTLETTLKLQSPRETFFINKLITHDCLKKYNVILFDCAPGFDVLTENALFASEHLIVPMSTEIGTAQASVQNIKKIQEFQARMNKKFQSISIVPTLVTNTKLSRQLFSMYESKFGNLVTSNSIRRAITAQESLIKKKSSIEYDQLCDLSQDFKKVIEELWNERIAAKVVQ
ncbi:MAG: ParA family protein [Oligoflexia bacterium]|nr:ParA family protein [Oligoflexia bacterium]